MMKNWLQVNYKFLILFVWILVFAFLFKGFFKLKTIIFFIGLALSILIVQLSKNENISLKDQLKISDDLIPWIHQFISEVDPEEKTRIYFLIYDKIRSESLLDKSGLDHENILNILEKHKPYHAPYACNLSKDLNYGISLSFE